MVAIGQTVTVVNKSGKVVKTSKHLANVFKEAKSAYLEKKAELTAKRDDGLSQKASSTHGSDSHRTTYERGPPRASTTYGSDSGHTTYERGSSRPKPKDTSRDDPQSSRHASRRSSHDHNSRTTSRREHSNTHHSRPAPERGYSDSFYATDRSSSTSKSLARTSTAPLTASNLRHATTPSTTPTTPTLNQSRTSSRRSVEQSELLRRRSDTDFTSSDRTLRPSHSQSSFDSDLAYGDDPAFTHAAAVAPPGAISTEDELRTKMSGLQRLLHEAECAQYSAKAVIKSLEKDPDAMAAVALTLAEISNLATKMAPGALMALKSSFPVIIALLLSPEFLIAGGVALGVTVVSFGGYKIVKRLKLKKAKKLKDAEGRSNAGEEEDEEEDEMAELEELSQLDRIDQWRRGIYLPPGADEGSVATSVEGEFVTPEAVRMLREEGVLAEKPRKEKEKSKDKYGKSKSKTAAAEKDLAKQLKEVEKQKKDLEKREKELAKQKDEILKASERNEKLERKATAAENEKNEKREKAEKETKQKQITEHGEDASVNESNATVSAENQKEKSDVQSLLKTIFRKTTEKEKGEVIA